MALAVDISKLSAARQKAFETSKLAITERIFSFPELLMPSMFSNASPVPTLPFDLVKTLVFPNSKSELIIEGYKSIDSMEGFSQALQWLLKEELTISKVMNKEFYYAIANLTNAINDRLFMVIPKLQEVKAKEWAITLRTIRRFQFQYGLPGFAHRFLSAVINEQKNEDDFWLMMIEVSNHFPEKPFIEEVIGRNWLNNYYLKLKSKLEEVSALIFNEKEKLFDSSTKDGDIHLDSLKENKLGIEKIHEELIVIFREFEFMKKHPIYAGIIGRLKEPFDRLDAICSSMAS